MFEIVFDRRGQSTDLLSGVDYPLQIISKRFAGGNKLQSRQSIVQGADSVFGVHVDKPLLVIALDFFKPR